MSEEIKNEFTFENPESTARPTGTPVPTLMAPGGEAPCTPR